MSRLSYEQRYFNCSPPDNMRGRVNAINSVFVGTSNEIGELESGVAGQLFGPMLAVAGGGIITIFVVLFFATRWPIVRNLHHLDDLRPH